MAEKKIGDFGVKIGGARKDMWRERGLGLADLDTLDEREYKEHITKDNIWLVPDYIEMVNGGMDKACAYYAKFVRDKIPKGPLKETRAYAEIYINLLNVYKEAVGRMKNAYIDIKRLPEILDEVAKEQGFGYLHTSPYYSIIRAIRLYDYEIQRLIYEAELQNFPYEFKGALKGLTIASNMSNSQPAYRILKGKTSACRQTFNSVKEAMDYAKAVVIPELVKPKEKAKSTVQKVIRPQLEGITRTGKDVRGDKVVSGDDLIKQFGFRGGEFGNWNTDADRQACLDYSYDAFADLASVLHSKPDFISLGGYKDKKLAIAFGARGKGGSGAVAHYEPSNIVINLTKMKGAGSLAHEWGHALDDFLGIKCADESMLTSYCDGYRRRDYKYPEIVKAVKEFMGMLKARPCTDEEMLEIKEKELKKYTDYIDSWVKNLPTYAGGTVEQQARVLAACEKFKEDIRPETFEDLCQVYKTETGRLPSKETRDAVKNLLIHYGWQKEAIDSYSKNGKWEHIAKKPTNYYKGAENLDKGSKKPYYTQNEELFARAFESYVEDVINNRGNKSDYLVHSTHCKFYPDMAPYPQGEERKLFNSKLKELLEMVVKEFSEYEVEEEQELAATTEENVTTTPEETDEDKNKFMLTIFKQECKDLGLSVNMGKTREKTYRDKEYYLIDFTEGYVKYVRVPKYLEETNNGWFFCDPSGKTDRMFTLSKEPNYKKIAEDIKVLNDEDVKRTQEEALKNVPDLLNNPNSLFDAGVSEAKKESQLILAAADELKAQAKKDGRQLNVTDEGYLLLYHGTSVDALPSIKNNGFNPNTAFSNAKTVGGVSKESPIVCASKFGEKGKVILLKVDPRGIIYDTASGDFLAPSGLKVCGEVWVKGTGKAVPVKKQEVKPVKPKAKSAEELKEKDLHGVEDAKILRAILTEKVKEMNVRRMPTVVFSNLLYKVQYNINVKYRKNLTILIRSIPQQHLQGNSKAWAMDTKGNLCISKSAEDRKRLEGLIEGVIEGLLPKQGYTVMQRNMLREGLTFMVCKTFNLDVRTYCTGKGFKKVFEADAVSRDRNITNFVNKMLVLYEEAIVCFL